MKISNNFIGGNIKVTSVNETDIYLENELRDSTQDWFYWAFCIEGAENKTITFHFQKNRLGYFGPAVSSDLKSWHWLDSVFENSFTYSFSANETKVYFAHSLLYHPNRFKEFASAHKFEISQLCISKKGRAVPCLKFGSGEKNIILTSRHHACESTGSYVLEGVLEAVKACNDYSFFCVPFVDYDGIIDGDQGKARAPHDHNRDYIIGEKSIYPETSAIRDFAEKNGCFLGFDFHSPWHKGDQNDNAFIVQNSEEKLDKLRNFAEIFESNITENSFKYFRKNDYPPNTGWNLGGATFSNYMTAKPENDIAFSLETAYFGTRENKITEQGLIALGKSFGKSIIEYAGKATVSDI